MANALDNSQNDWLQMGSGSRHSERIYLSEHTLILGRGPEADHSFEYPGVSRKHVEITQVSTNWTVRDLGSSNGTKVNGKGLSTEPMILRDGDIISLAGTVTLRYRMYRSAAETVGMTRSISDSVDGAQTLRVDAATRNVYVGITLLDPPLSQKQFDVLNYLYQQRDQVIDKDELARVGWPEYADFGVGDEEIKQTIYRIRTRLNTIQAGAGKMLQSRRNVGYILIS